MEKTQKLIYVTWKEGKFFVAQCLNIEVSSFGKTKKEALANVQEAVELYFEDNQRPKLEKVERPTIETGYLQYA